MSKFVAERELEIMKKISKGDCDRLVKLLDYYGNDETITLVL